MEKISTIKLLQKFIIAFMVSVILNFISSILSSMNIVLPGIIGTIVSYILGILSFGTYILIWISYAKSKNILPTRGKYLLLGILLTIFTIVLTVFMFFVSNMIITQAMNDGLVNFAATANTSMDMDSINSVLNELPGMKLLNLVDIGMVIITSLVYLGIGYVIFDNNKATLIEAEAEYQSAYEN